MKNYILTLAMAVPTIALAGHVPEIEIRIDGNAARFIRPEVYFHDENKVIGLYVQDGVYWSDRIGPGAYTLTLFDKDSGSVLMVENMTLIQSGHDVEGNTRHIDCSFHNGSIDCRNYY